LGIIGAVIINNQNFKWDRAFLDNQFFNQVRKVMACIVTTYSDSNLIFNGKQFIHLLNSIIDDFGILMARTRSLAY